MLLALLLAAFQERTRRGPAPYSSLALHRRATPPLATTPRRLERESNGDARRQQERANYFFEPVVV